LINTFHIGYNHARTTIEALITVIDAALSFENLFILNSFFFYISEKAILDKIAITNDIGVRGKGFEPLNSCENRS
jgi:hypothetical protein